MERSNYPFPLAVNSSQHSHYHRFLLGADAAILAPFPKPYCLGELAAQFPGLAESLNLPRWRKLYHASIPWTPGFGPGHYELGNVPPHRPLPRDYGRPPRKYGAFDFVQIADPSVSALALVAGDRRIVERFVALSDRFCARVESGVCARSAGTSGSRRTGRMLAGQFAEPNNRWLMPFLHVHSRVLNFTSFRENPGRLECIEAASLAREGQKAKQDWTARQAGLLADLGYRADVGRGPHAVLRVEGVCPRLVAAIEAPRIAVLRMLERALAGDRRPSAERLSEELPPVVIAALSERIESLLCGNTSATTARVRSSSWTNARGAPRPTSSSRPCFPRRSLTGPIAMRPAPNPWRRPTRCHAMRSWAPPPREHESKRAAPNVWPANLTQP